MSARPRSLVVLIGVVLIGVAVTVAWISLGDPGPQAAPTFASDFADEAVHRSGGIFGKAEEATDGPSDLQRHQVPRTVVASEPVVLRGRCVAAESGLPLAGCEVTLRGYLKRLDGGEFSSWEDPEPILTNSTGRFEFRFAHADGYGRSLAIRRQDRVFRTGALNLGSNATLDFGDLPLRSGASIRARVIDTDGQPVAMAQVTFRSSDPSHRLADGVLREYWSSQVVSAADGAVVLRYPLPTGSWQIAVRDSPPLVEPGRILIEDNEFRKSFDIVVRRVGASDVLAGTVVDEAGKAVPGASVLAADPQARAAPVRTKPDGTFVLYRNADEYTGKPSKLTVRAVGGYEPLQTTDSYVWGTTGIRLVMKRLSSLCIQVVDASSNEPIERFAVKCCARHSPSFQTKPTRFLGDHPEGRLEIPQVALGANVLIVYPEGSEHAPSSPIMFDMPAGGREPLRVELRRFTCLDVNVVDGNGDPVAGTRIELLSSMTRTKIDPRTPAVDLQTLFEDVPRSGMAVRLVAAATGEGGRATLAWQTSPEELTLRVLGPGHVPVQKHAVVLSENPAPIRIVVTRGGRLHGRIRPVASLRRLVHISGESEARAKERQVNEAGLVLREVGGQGRELPETSDRAFAIGEDGSFSIDGIPSGTWQVLLLKSKGQAGGRASTFVYERPLAAVSLSDGQSRELDIDIGTGFEPGGISGTLYHNGTPSPATELVLHYARPDPGKHRGRVLTRKTDPHGGFLFESLEPGYFRILARLRNAGTGLVVTLPATSWQELRPGQMLQQDVWLATAEVRIRVLQADGITPAKNTVFSVSDKQNGVTLSAVTNEAGVLVLESVPAGHFEVTARLKPPHKGGAQVPQNESENAEVLVGSILAPPGPGSSHFELRMPKQESQS